MNYLKALIDPAWWKTLLGSDFNRGFIAALCVILVLMILLMLLRAVIGLIFRTRRCSGIEVKRNDGSTFVSRDVIFSVVGRELADYPALHAEKIVLTRRGAHYQLTIHCSYLLSDQSGIPAFCDEFKPRLRSALEKGFGINTLDQIRFWIIESGNNGVAEADLPPVAGKDAYIGL